ARLFGMTATLGLQGLCQSIARRGWSEAFLAPKKRKTPHQGGVCLDYGYFDLAMPAAVASATAAAVTSATRGCVPATTAHVATASSVRWSCSASAKRWRSST